MKTPRTRIASVIAKHSLKDGISKQYATGIAAYLLDERRTRELGSLLRDVAADWAEAGFVEVIASSAHPLSIQTKSDIAKRAKQVYPGAQEVVVTEAHDPDVVGGVRLNLPNQQLDLSVRGKLSQFKQLTIGV